MIKRTYDKNVHTYSWICIMFILLEINLRNLLSSEKYKCLEICSCVENIA